MPPLLWKLPRATVDLSVRALVMGVVNVTPDSFSDGGNFPDPDSAVDHALALVADGAEILDIGGESTRPGAAAVGEDEELRRVLPVITRLRPRTSAWISIDTSKAAVARAAMAAGADIINDVTALRGDPAMAEVARETRAGVVLMHMQGDPRTMQQNPAYTDVVTEVGDFLRQRLAAALRCGMAEESIVLDPGIGFGKTPAHNLALLRATPEFTLIGRPILGGVSRKSFLSWLGEAPALADRHWPGVAVTSYCRELGARIFRVHDAKPHHEALRMTEAIIGHV
jgi:dihydropteroate synthase